MRLMHHQCMHSINRGFNSSQKQLPIWILKHLDLSCKYSILDQMDQREIKSRLSLCARKGNTRDFSALIHKYYIVIDPPESLLICLLAKAWSRSKDQEKWEKIKDIYSDSKKYDLINPALLSIYLDSCGFYGNIGDLMNAWNYFGTHKPYFISSNHWNSYIQALLNLNEGSLAFLALKSMPRHFITCKTLVTFISPLNKSRQDSSLLDESWDWIERNGYFWILQDQNAFTRNGIIL